MHTHLIQKRLTSLDIERGKNNNTDDCEREKRVVLSFFALFFQLERCTGSMTSASQAKRHFRL